MVSVCMAVFNGARYVVPQVESILRELGDGDELVVSDDGSDDDTLSLLEQIGDPRVRIVHHDGDGGPAYNFENALRHAQGDIIFLSDQDDVWLPGKVQAMCRALEDAVVAVSDCRIVDDSLECIHESYFALLPPHEGVLANLWKNHYLGCCMAFRREVLQRALPFPKNVVMHDIWLGLCAATMGETSFVRRPLMLYRRHGDNVSSATDKSGNSYLYRLCYRLRTARQLTARWLRRRR